MAADILDCDIANIAVQGVDTDQSPYDTGSYASATTYVTGGAVVKTAEKLRAQILEAGADILGYRQKKQNLTANRYWDRER